MITILIDIIAFGMAATSAGVLLSGMAILALVNFSRP